MTILTPNDAGLDELCAILSQLSGSLEEAGGWPAQQLKLCADYGVYRWFVESQFGGLHWSAADICRGYLALSAACLTTTFVITQFMGACQRIAASGNEHLRDELERLLNGEQFATVGISHLTTSRQYLSKPVLRAAEQQGGYVLEGYSPWVTGALYADHYVVGATCNDGRQILTTVPRGAHGLHVPLPKPLMALNASQTGPVQFNNVFIDQKCLLAGPVNEVMKQGTGANTGGIQTSTLALGLARAAIDYLSKEGDARSDLHEATETLRQEQEELVGDLLAIAQGQPVCTNDVLRTRANSLVLRATQASLVAAKGAGYVQGHPTGRWCREAMFFLVWSCPQNVLAAHLCELAGLAD